MKYFNLDVIKGAISLIKDGNDTREHVTSRATSGMLSFYFRPENSFIITPEQTQLGGKRPDYTIERFNLGTTEFIHHCFVEVKSLVNSNIGNILNQLHDTVLFTMDHSGNYSAFMIAVKGTKIAFYTYHTFSSLLDENGILHYKGFIPLNYQIPSVNYIGINECNLLNYDNYVRLQKFHTSSSYLSDLGALSNDNIKHPHILDLLNEKHKEEIHRMFLHVVENTSNIFKD